jgi:hypothetical protein
MSTMRVDTPLLRAADARPSTTDVLPTPPLRLQTLTTITPETLSNRAAAVGDRLGGIRAGTS